LLGFRLDGTVASAYPKMRRLIRNIEYRYLTTHAKKESKSDSFFV